MSEKKFKLELETQQNDFNFKTEKSNLNISFNRIAFIFFIFFIISLIFSIHLLHLGSRKINFENNQNKDISLKLYRGDIVDRDGNFLSKTVSTKDIGISPSKIIDKKKLILNLKLIFPNKNYEEIKKRIEKGKFFYFEKKFLRKIMKN